MNWPELVLTGYLSWLWAAGILKYIYNENDTYKCIGAFLGYLGRYATIFYLLYVGGFYN